MTSLPVGMPCPMFWCWRGAGGLVEGGSASKREWEGLHPKGSLPRGELPQGEGVCFKGEEMGSASEGVGVGKPPGPGTNIWWRLPKRAVSILLECILVLVSVANYFIFRS